MSAAPARGYWHDFPATYRAEEVAQILSWIGAQESGAIIGGSGAGKSNLVGFLTQRADVTGAYLDGAGETVVFLLFDINSLPLLNSVYFYRGMFQTLLEAADRLPAQLQAKVEALDRPDVNWADSFVALSALQRGQRIFVEEAGMRLVWMLDRFDEACRTLEAQVFNSLRSLRDQMKGRVNYVIATRHPLTRLRDTTEIDEFFELIAANTCWVGPMVRRDGEWIAAQMAARLNTEFAAAVVDRMLTVTGGLPAFLKAVTIVVANEPCDLNQTPDAWAQELLQRNEFDRGCREIWNDLSDDQQQALSSLAQGLPIADAGLEASLRMRGLLNSTRMESGAAIFSPIFAAYVRGRLSRSAEPQGGLSIDPRTQDVYRDGTPLASPLTRHEHLLLSYFLAHANEICSKDELMAAVWPDDLVVDGIRDDRLAQLVKRLREKVEPQPANPVHVLTVRGRGYRFVQDDASAPSPSPSR